MTFVLFVFGILLVAISGRLVAQALIIPRLKLKAHLRAIQEYGFDPASAAEAVEERSKLRASLRRLAFRVGKGLMTRFPHVSALQRKDLSAAGFYDIAPEIVHGYRALAAVGLPALVLSYIALVGAKFSLLILVLVIVCVAAGWALPSATIRRRGAARLDTMDAQLPELIDLLVATVEAGMGFTGSIGLISARFKGALGDELRLALKQQTLGISTEQALTDMAERCDTPAIRAFVRTVNRGESMGVSIGPILRELTVDMRRRRRQSAKEKMQKAPVKMLFPLMFLIFPALMIVLLYPAVYSVLGNLGSVGS
ncbi:MAG: type II secretion system F family protein [Solirubrobacteraceae bacterium]|jgi:tight adherence protein C